MGVAMTKRFKIISVTLGLILAPVAMGMQQDRSPEQRKSNMNLVHFTANGFIEDIPDLLERGADVNTKAYQGLGERNPQLNDATPLHLCAWHDYKEIASLLLEHGAEVDARERRGLTPLHTAIWCGSSRMIQVLLDRKASIEAGDDKLCTPLHVASHGVHLEPLYLLLNRGADMEARNAKGSTPLECALSGFHLEQKARVRALLERGAQIEEGKTHGWCQN